MRKAFTLIEMLIVVSIIAIITVAIVAVAPRFAHEYKIAKGADMLQQWLLTAKTRAKHDQIPTGLRLFDGPGALVRECQYVQIMPDFQVMPGVVHDPAFPPPNLKPYQVRSIVCSGTTVTLEPPEMVGVAPVFPPPYADFTGAFTDTTLWPVHPGDYIVINGVAHGISSMTPTTLTLRSTAPTTTTKSYNIIRGPSVCQGETPLQFPKDIVIDPAQSKNGNSMGIVADIIFNPNGSVRDTGIPGDQIVFWVKDETKDRSSPGEQFLVVVKVKTGFIAVHPVDLSSGDFYSFTRDARSSGL